MLLPFVLFAIAQMPLPAVDPTLPPAGTQLVATTEGRGVQIYHCAALPDNQFAWKFDAPLATLYQPGTTSLVGTHTQGPAWVWSDGSAVRGSVQVNQPAPGTGNIPWLLLQAKATAANMVGRLAHVTWVRRSDTKGGAAPATGCDANHASAQQQVPYTATYTFYSAIQTNNRPKPVAGGR